MFGLSSCPGSLPYPASPWWTAPPGHAGGPVCQQHTTNQWGVHPPNIAPSWAGPTTHIHFWGEQSAQHMHQALAHQQPLQPLTIMAYPSHQPSPQQNQHCTAPQPAQAQPAEHSLLLQCMAQLETAVKTQQEEATHRMTQLEAAVKAQQEEASQGSADMKQYVSEQMAQWRTWKESKEPQLSRSRIQSEAAKDTERSEPGEMYHNAQTLQVTSLPKRRPKQAVKDTLEPENSPSTIHRLISLENHFLKYSDKSTKRTQAQPKTRCQ